MEWVVAEGGGRDLYNARVLFYYMVCNNIIYCNVNLLRKLNIIIIVVHI